MSDTEFNRYKSPESDVVKTPDLSGRPIATKGRRFGTLLADMATFNVLGFITSLAIALVAGPAWLRFIEGWTSYVYSFTLFFAYYMICEGLWGRTMGKLIFGTVVVADPAGPLTWRHVLKRTLSRLIPFEGFTFLDGGVGLHDKISKTRVVLTRL